MELFKSRCDVHLGLISIAKHQTELTNGQGKPVHCAFYWGGPKARESNKAEIQKVLEMRVIESVETEWAVPILLAPKKDGSLRFCAPYRKLNAVTLRESHCITLKDEFLDSFRNALIFSTLDANGGYWQIWVEDADPEKLHSPLIKDCIGFPACHLDYAKHLEPSNGQ